MPSAMVPATRPRTLFGLGPWVACLLLLGPACRCGKPEGAKGAAQAAGARPRQGTILPPPSEQIPFPSKDGLPLGMAPVAPARPLTNSASSAQTGSFFFGPTDPVAIERAKASEENTRELYDRAARDYESRCVGCHGHAGAAKAKAPDFSKKTTLPAIEALRAVLTRGHADLPPAKPSELELKQLLIALTSSRQ